MKKAPAFYSLSQASPLCGIYKDNLRQMIHRHTVKGYKIGRDWFITERELLRIKALKKARTERF